MRESSEVERERTRLNFADAVRERFAFLLEVGFSEIEELPTIVRYQKGDLEIRFYHGRKSFEIGFEIVRVGMCYGLSQLIRVSDPEEAERSRNYVATTPKGVSEGLARLEGLVKRYGEGALRGDPELFAMLADNQKAWAEGYELDVLAGQLRPKAHTAFRSGDYSQAAELYERIRPRLSDTELKKLVLAKERAGNRQ